MSRDENDNGLDLDVFDIPGKEAEPEALLKWRVGELRLGRLPSSQHVFPIVVGSWQFVFDGIVH